MSLMQEMGAKALRLGLPLGAQLDLTYRCNERCVHATSITTITAR